MHLRLRIGLVLSKKVLAPLMGVWKNVKLVRITHVVCLHLHLKWYAICLCCEMMFSSLILCRESPIAHENFRSYQPMSIRTSASWNAKLFDSLCLTSCMPASSLRQIYNKSL